MPESNLVAGSCDPKYSKVKDVFEKSFSKGEVGAAVSVYIDGKSVIDLWGGTMDQAKTKPWQENTLMNVYSTTKGMVSICAHRLVEQGKLDLDAPVAKYWPEFAQKNKQDIPVNYLLSHRSGLAAVSKPLTMQDLYDWDPMIKALEEQEPWWEPGTKHGYHAVTFGFLVGELIRRIDGRTVGKYFNEEIAKPLGLDFHIGFGPDLDSRCGEMIPAPQPKTQGNDKGLFGGFGNNPDSVQAKAFLNPIMTADMVQTRAWRAAEIPASNGHGTARSLAKVYSALARGGELDGYKVLGPETIARANAEQALGPDQVLGPLQTRFGLGYFMTSPMIPFGPNPNSFGHPGAGGSIGFADPDAKLGFGYVMNQMQMSLGGGAHGFALINEIYSALS